jgi:hypothetical protein
MQETQTYVEGYASHNQIEILEHLKMWRDAGVSFARDTASYSCTVRDLNDFVYTRFWASQSVRFQFLDFGDGHFVIRNQDLALEVTLQSSVAHVVVYSPKRDVINAILGAFADRFPVSGNAIHWMYNTDGRILQVPLSTARKPLDEMYPFLKEPLESYYSRFLNSTASILLLIGPPGTGKTSFIRGLLHYAESDALVCYDTAILERDTVFAHFLEDEDLGMMVLEDADNFLRPRKEGNSMMHRFLNVGDGLVTMAHKKMIFSTNLPSIKDVDPALVRPGRCFDVLTFDHLNREEAERLAQRVGTTLHDDQVKYSISEIFNGKSEEIVNEKVTNKIGFV